MKLVIDIPDKDYEFIKDLQSLIIGGRGNCKTIQYNVINAIKNGTPYEEQPAEWEESVPVHIGVVGEGINIPTYECSNPYCAMTVTKRTLYCPNCGRRMKK